VGYINVLIKGIPYAKSKLRGDRQAPARWSKVIVEQTGALPRVKEACVVKVTFLLPPDKFPADYPYGPDLDNLLKRRSTRRSFPRQRGQTHAWFR